MTPTRPPTEIPLADLAPPMCPQCGYTLKGLPAEGHCPECGLTYGAEQIVFYAWGQQPSTRKSPAWFIALLAFDGLFVLYPWFAVLSFPLGIFPRVIQSMPWYFWPLVVGGYGYWIAMPLAAVRRRYRNLKTMPAPIQVRLSRRGFVIREGIGKARLFEWKNNALIKLERTRQKKQRLTIRNGGKWALSVVLEPLLSDDALLFVDDQVRKWIAAANLGETT